MADFQSVTRKLVKASGNCRPERRVHQMYRYAKAAGVDTSGINCTSNNLCEWAGDVAIAASDQRKLDKLDSLLQGEVPLCANTQKLLDATRNGPVTEWLQRIADRATAAGLDTSRIDFGCAADDASEQVIYAATEQKKLDKLNLS